MSKISWSDIYTDFRARYPTRSKLATHYDPAGYLSIVVYFSDGLKMTYDYSNRQGKYLAS